MDESLNLDETADECHPRAIHHPRRGAARKLVQARGRLLPSRWMLEGLNFQFPIPGHVRDL